MKIKISNIKILANQNITPYEYYVSKVGLNALSVKKYNILENFFKLKLKELKYVDCQTSEQKLICEELKQSIALLQMIDHFSVAISDKITLDEKIKYLDYVLLSKDKYLKKQKELWLARNKEGGLEKSMKRLTDFFATIENIKSFLLKN